MIRDALVEVFRFDLNHMNMGLASITEVGDRWRIKSQAVGWVCSMALTAAVSPVAVHGPCLTLRKPVRAKKTLSDLVTARQLGMIRAIAREIGIDADQESNSVMRCRTDEMSKRAASSLIQHLQEMQKSKGAAVVPQAA